LVHNKNLLNSSYFPQFHEIPADDPKLRQFLNFRSSAAGSFFLLGCVLKHTHRSCVRSFVTS